MDKSTFVVNIIMEKGLTVTEVARKAGLPYTTLDSMLKRGLGGSNIDNVIKLCKVLGIKVEDLYSVDAQQSIKKKSTPEKDKLLKKISRLNEFGCKLLSIYSDGLLTNEDCRLDQQEEI